MSASREKKSRQENLAGGYVDPRTKREKDEQAKDRRSNALYIAIAVIFVIVGIVVTVANSKVIERSADAVTIGNETYTAADVSYFYHLQQLRLPELLLSERLRSRHQQVAQGAGLPRDRWRHLVRLFSRSGTQQHDLLFASRAEG